MVFHFYEQVHCQIQVNSVVTSHFFADSSLQLWIWSHDQYIKDVYAFYIILDSSHYLNSMIVVISTASTL